ncbi:DUF4274 domain-containing protein [Paenibacillus senegalensis]|uniref:DUF4274 domain-containing protein n=1 Tax=Paenibacillus senegalensis TaxID=1465766 RepID=UPI000287F34B|nr:DUF4274 domain-containing protein [Paenibacillus senegalensis]
MEWKTVSKANDISQIREAVKRLDIHERDERGRTPLLIFITNRAPLEALKILLDHGAELEAADKLGDSPLKKAAKFQQKEAARLLLDYGAKLDSPGGILETAWNIARFKDLSLADMLLATKGAVRLTLTEEEDKTVDDILHDESREAVCRKIRQLPTAELLHAVVQRYNWDDGPEAMLAVFEHPACAEITKLDMYDLLEGDYWLELEEAPDPETQGYRKLALKLKPVIDAL